MTSTSPNSVHILRIENVQHKIRFFLNDILLESLDVLVSELTSREIYVSATLYESGQEVGLVCEPFRDAL